MANKVKVRGEIGAVCRKDIRDEYAIFNLKEELYARRALDRVEDMRSSIYAGVDPRRRQEMADAGMVREDHAAMANLSNVAVHREYPKVAFYANPFIDDTIEY